MSWKEALAVKYGIRHSPAWRFLWRTYDWSFGYLIWAKDPRGETIILSSMRAWFDARREERAA